jgi:hypothetical protein
MKSLVIRSGIFRNLGVAMLVLSLLIGIVGETSANQSGPGVGDKTQNMVVLCQLGGGTSSSTITRTVDGIRAATVRCVGGTFDGLVCSFFTDLTICTWPGEGANSSSGNDWKHDMVVDPHTVDSGNVEQSEMNAEPGGASQDEGEGSLSSATSEPTIVIEATKIVESEVTVATTVTPDTSTSGASSTSTDGLPEGEITAEATETPVIEEPDELPIVTEVQDAAPIVEVTLEAAP